MWSYTGGPISKYNLPEKGSMNRGITHVKGSVLRKPQLWLFGVTWSSSALKSRALSPRMREHVFCVNLTGQASPAQHQDAIYFLRQPDDPRELHNSGVMPAHNFVFQTILKKNKSLKLVKSTHVASNSISLSSKDYK